MSRIAILGGGYTGLTAALRLARQGHDVTVFEAGPAIGGLAGDFTVEGKPLERAYHHLFRTDTSVIGLAKELGIGDKLLWHESKQALFYGGKLYPFAGPVDLLKFSPLPFLDRIRTGVVVLWLQINGRWRGYVPVSAMEWMRRWAGKAATKVIWEPLLRGKFHQYADKVSMAWLWARLHTRANSKERGELTEKLGYFDGGFVVLTDALADAVKAAGATITTSAPAQAVWRDGDGVALQVADATERFDSVLATVPSHVLAALLEKGSEHATAAPTPEYLAQLRSTTYLAARVMIFSSEQSLSDAYWHNINDLDIPFLVFIQHDNLTGAERYGTHLYYLATYVPTDTEDFTRSDDDTRALWFEELTKIFPHFDPEQVRETHHFRFANAQHIVDPGYEQRIPDHRTPIEGVYLANFAQIFPEDRGTNFAVRDGDKVAAMIADDLVG